MTKNPLVETVMFEMTALGLSQMKLLNAHYDKHSFGDAEALFQYGSLLFRFVRDRGQDFLDIAPTSEPDHFFQFDDVELAMGWKTIDEILSKKEPEGLKQLLVCVKENIKTLESVFSPERAAGTVALLEKISKERGEEQLRKLKKK